MTSALRTARACALILLLPLLATCGGGGGGGGGGSSGGGTSGGTGGGNSYPLQIAATPSSLTSPLVQGVAKLFTVSAQVTGTVSTGSTVYVVIDDTSGVIQADKVQITENSTTSYTAELITSTTLAVGEEKGNINVRVCSSTTCSTIYGETAVPYDFTVASATNTTAVSTLPGVGDWQTERGTSAQTSFVPVSLDPSSFTVRWLQSNMEQLAPDDDITGASMVTDSADQLVIAMIPATENIDTKHKSGGGLIAYSEIDGSIVWHTTFSDSGGNPLGLSPLAISNGVIYTTQYTIVGLGYSLGVSYGGNLIFTGIDARTGTTLFQTQIAETFGFNLSDSLNRGCAPGSPVVNGNVVFVNPACIPDETGASVALPVVALDGTTGHLLWTGAAPGGYLGTSFVLQGSDLVYSTPPAQTQTTLNDLNPSDGTIRWQSPLTNSAVGYQYLTPALDGAGNAILPANSSNGPAIDKYDLASGNLIWQVTPAPPQNGLVSGLQATAVANGLVYFASGIESVDGPGLDGTVTALNITDGTTAWSWKTPDANYTTNINAMIVTNNLLFLSTDKGVYAVDVSTHKTVWTLPIPGYQMVISPSGMLYIVTATQSSITDSGGVYQTGSQALVAVNLH